MTANRALMDELGFALKHDERQGWIVIEDGADDRCATITEQVLWDALLSLAATVAPAELDVTKILLNVVPGDDGEGLEIYAKSVDDVVALLTKQGERIEELESRVAVPVAPAIPRTAATCSDAAYQLGLAVRAALDRVACPDAFMRVAAEAVFARHAEYPGPPAPVAPAEPAKFTTIEEGTAEVVRFFTEHLRRHDFTRYIKKSLAVDFCCAIAPTLHAVMAAPVAPASVGWPDFVRRTNEEYAAWCKITYTPDSLDNRGMPTDGGLHGLWAWQEQERRKMDAPVAPAEHINLRRADGTLSGVFIEPAASEAAAVAADLRNWLDFLPGHAQPTVERAVRLLETKL